MGIRKPAKMEHGEVINHAGQLFAESHAMYSQAEVKLDESTEHLASLIEKLDLEIEELSAVKEKAKYDMSRNHFMKNKLKELR